MESARHFVFTCPNCGERIHLDEGVRDQLVEFGCLVCGERLTREAFEPM